MTLRALLSAFLLMLLQTATLPAVEIIAHRGASADAPENTLSAMKLGWEQNADAIELDLWLSSDGKLVVFHDADTRRFETKARKVSATPLKDLQQLDVGGWKNPKYKGEKIPSLESILKTIPKGRRAVLEVKCGPEILPELKRVLKEAGRPDKELMVISFNYQTIKESKKVFPGMEHLFLYSYKKDEATGKFPELKTLIQQAKEAGIEGLNLQYTWPITKEFVDEVKGSGLKLYVWTVDDAAVARKLKDNGVHGITTNIPKVLREALAH